MPQERFSSFLGSLCLHLGVFALVLLWPAPEPPLREPKGPATDIGIVTIGAPGKRMPQAQRSEPKAGGKQDLPKPQPQEEPPQQQKPLPNPQAKPQEKPELKPIKKPEPVETPDPDAVKIPKDIKHNATKQTPQEKPQDKKPPQANETAKKPPPANATSAKPTKNATGAKPAKPKESLDDVLKGMQASTGGGQKGKGKTSGAKAGSGGGSLSNVLDEMGKGVGGSGDDDYGTGPGGKGGDGVGRLGAYGESVVSRVKPNWQWANRADRKNYSAEVNVKIAPDGAVLDVRLIRSSGNTLFDASIIRAVKATATLEAPPTVDEQNINIYFDSDMLAK